MRCVYINLAQALERRESLEKNFYSLAPDNWSIERFNAIDKDFVFETKTSGKLRPGAKACFMSHAKVIRESKNADGHILILEDDAQFGPSSFSVIDSFIREDSHPQWDILFTDVGIPSPSVMIDLLKARRELEKKKKCIAMDLAALTFYGSTAYIINEKSKDKIIGMLDQELVFDTAYDMWLRKEIWGKRINAYALFPFATTVSLSANNSSIQPQDENLTDTVWNLYRRFMWVDRSLGGDSELIDKLEAAHLDAESGELGSLLSLICSPNFKIK